jgi:hypothetical protein
MQEFKNEWDIGFRIGPERAPHWRQNRSEPGAWERASHHRVMLNPVIGKSLLICRIRSPEERAIYVT